MLVPDCEELSQMIEHYGIQLSNVAIRSIERATSDVQQRSSSLVTVTASALHAKSSPLSALSEKLVARRPHSLVQQRQKRMLTLHSNLTAAVKQSMSDRLSRIGTLESHLEATDPFEVLQRGFTLTQDSSGKLVRSSKTVKKGQQIQTVLADGTIDSKVECTS